MRLLIRGHRLPGLTCGSYTNVHVGLQVSSEPVGLVPADAAVAEWVAEIHTKDGDFRGPAVQGKKGERFVYLTWGTVAGDSFSMFRRAKLMLADLPADADEVAVDVDLTDEDGMPRCAQLRPRAARHVRVSPARTGRARTASAPAAWRRAGAADPRARARRAGL